VQALSRLALIDEYHLLVHPVLLGGGTSLFASLGSRLNLKKTREETFDSSLVLNVYQTERENG
jgi:dihydrofolate reductase